MSKKKNRSQKYSEAAVNTNLVDRGICKLKPDRIPQLILLK